MRPRSSSRSSRARGGLTRPSASSRRAASRASRSPAFLQRFLVCDPPDWADSESVQLALAIISSRYSVGVFHLSLVLGLTWLESWWAQAMWAFASSNESKTRQLRQSRRRDAPVPEARAFSGDVDDRVADPRVDGRLVARPRLVVAGAPGEAGEVARAHDARSSPLDGEPHRPPPPFPVWRAGVGGECRLPQTPTASLWRAASQDRDGARVRPRSREMAFGRAVLKRGRRGLAKLPYARPT